MDTKYLSGFFSKKPDFIEKFSHYLGEDLLYSDIISIGSGTGYFEYHLQNLLEQKIICIDPEPCEFGKFHPTEYFLPKHKLLSDFQTTCENISDKIILLMWPNPQSIKSVESQSYDYDAIYHHKPRMFVVSYELTGASGSNKLINLLNSNNDVTTLNINGKKYNLLFCNDIDIYSNRELYILTYRLIMYIRDDYVKNYYASTDEYPTFTKDNMKI